MTWERWQDLLAVAMSRGVCPAQDSLDGWQEGGGGEEWFPGCSQDASAPLRPLWKDGKREAEVQSVPQVVPRMLVLLSDLFQSSPCSCLPGETDSEES